MEQRSCICGPVARVGDSEGEGDLDVESHMVGSEGVYTGEGEWVIGMAYGADGTLRDV